MLGPPRCKFANRLPTINIFSFVSPAPPRFFRAPILLKKIKPDQKHLPGPLLAARRLPITRCLPSAKKRGRPIITRKFVSVPSNSLVRICQPAKCNHSAGPVFGAKPLPRCPCFSFPPPPTRIRPAPLGDYSTNTSEPLQVTNRFAAPIAVTQTSRQGNEVRFPCANAPRKRSHEFYVLNARPCPPY